MAFDDNEGTLKIKYPTKEVYKTWRNTKGDFVVVLCTLEIIEKASTILHDIFAFVCDETVIHKAKTREDHARTCQKFATTGLLLRL